MHAAADDLNAGARGFFGGAGLEIEARDGRDRRERFAAEAERRDGKQIVGGAELRSGVALEGEQRVVAYHAAAVVHDADELAAAAFDLDADAGGAGIERVFEQFLDHGRGTVHHFAGGDLVGDLVGEYVDAAHGLRVRQGVVENFPDRDGTCQKDREGILFSAGWTFFAGHYYRGRLLRDGRA